MRWPSSVRCDSVRSRRTNSPPSSVSRALMARLRAGCDTLHGSAALAKFSVSLSAKKKRIWSFPKVWPPLRTHEQSTPQATLKRPMSARLPTASALPLQKSGPWHVPRAAQVKCYIIFAAGGRGTRRHLLQCMSLKVLRGGSLWIYRREPEYLRRIIDEDKVARLLVG